MPAISSLGIGSGLDLSTLVQNLVTAEGQTSIFRFDRREANYQAELSALGVFKSALSDFKTAQQGLLSIGDFQTVSAESGDSNLYSVTAFENAQVGRYSIEVQGLAQSQKLASKAFSNNTDVVGSGTLTFRFGSYDSAGNTFTANAKKTTQSVTIGAADNTLSAIRDEVNKAKIGVSASIIDDGTGHRLVFSSDDTGAENSLQITVSGDLDSNNQDDAGLSQLAYDPTAVGLGSGKNLTETVAAKDALLIVDGLTVSRSTNSIDGVIQGVTLDLLSATLGKTTDLTVSKESGDVSDKVKQFVEDLNSLISNLDELTHYNAETREAGPLLGDFTLRNIESKIRNILSDEVTGLSGSVVSLTNIGISTQTDGTLALDSSKLQSALDADPDAVARLFSKSGQVSDSLLRFSGSKTDSIPGEYAINITQLATQGIYSAATAASFPRTIDNTNNTLSVKIDGVDSTTINLTQSVYNTGNDLAAELQSRINSDSALATAGASVTVTFQSGKFEITSNQYGSSSSVEITAVGTGSSTSLGLSVGAGTTGVDVAGTINGLGANGSGQTLTGIGKASGLSIDVLGGALGSRGDLSFSQGVSVKFDTLISSFLGTDSVVDSRISSLNDRIAGIGDQRIELNQRLESLEARLVAQFTALDTLLSQLQTTSSFLTQQLSSLPGSSNSN